MLSRRSWLAGLGALVALATCCPWPLDDSARQTSDLPLEPWAPSVEKREAWSQYLKWSCQVREEITHALRRGELTLWEAAVCFREVNTRRPPGVVSGSELHPGSSEEERLCRHVIQWTRIVLMDEMQTDGLLLRLEAELEERLGQGELRLPELPTGFVDRFDPGDR
jgi:hypothetical protein